MSLLQYAQKYRELGFSVVPCSPPTKDEQGKDTKKPRINWAEYQEKQATESKINEWFKRWPDSRIGLVTGEISNLFVIDLDTEQAKIKIDEEFIPDSLILPVAQSPSGGYHYYFQYEKGLSNKTNIDGLGLDTRGEGGFIMAPPSPGLAGSQYKWVEGLEIWQVETPPLPKKLKKYIDSFSLYSGVPGPTPESGKLSFSQPGRDTTLFHLANHLVKGGMPESNIREYLRFFGNHCNPPFPVREIEGKIQSALKRAYNKERSIAQEVREFIDVTEGNISVTEVSQNVTKCNKHSRSVRMELGRLVKNGVLERIGSKVGVYRKISSSFTKKNFKDVDTTALNILLPLGMSKFVALHQRDMILIGGQTNAGKTTFCLEIAKLNMRRHDVFYFSTELSEFALKKRLLESDVDIDAWHEYMVFSDEFHNIIDIVQPDAINIIDWVKPPGGDYAQIAPTLSSIRERLSNGLVICCLQKKSDQAAFAGGEHTLNEASLAFSLNRLDGRRSYRCEIVKSKDNIVDYDPVGFFREYEIKNGITILPCGVWESRYDRS